MNELKDLISKKRKINETIRNSIISSSNNNNNSCVLKSANSTDGDDVVDRDSGIDKKKTMKFIRQADLRKMEEMELMRKQEELDLLRAQRQQQQKLNSNHHDGSVHDSMKGDFATTTTMMNNSSLKHNIASIASKSTINVDDLSSYTLLSTSEVKMKLRRLRQPITLFGEEIEQRLQRLVEFIREGILMSGSSHGFDEVDGYDVDDIKTGLNRLETEHEEAELDAQDREDARDKGAEQGGDDNHDDEDEDEDDLKDGSGRDRHSSRLEWDPSIHYSTLKHLTPEKVVYKFFRALIKQWEVDLHQLRDDAEKRSAKGKMETRTQKQCKDYIRPLFRMCKKKEVPFSILDKLVLMVKHCEEGNFLAANDQYIRTAIGNAAWPIGLTMVGIHERSGREKISTSKVAHIMNNELERKYLTSIKRLMTYAQTKRTDIAPSMKMLNK